MRRNISKKKPNDEKGKKFPSKMSRTHNKSIKLTSKHSNYMELLLSHRTVALFTLLTNEKLHSK